MDLESLYPGFTSANNTFTPHFTLRKKKIKKRDKMMLIPSIRLQQMQMLPATKDERKKKTPTI